MKEQKGRLAAETLLNRILTWTGLAGLILSGALIFLSRHLVFAVGPVADKILASFLRESSVTALEYANRIIKILFSIFTASYFYAC